MQRCGMRSRRGSMQLGIETVVILIIAIVLLGTLIYFIKSLIDPKSVGTILEGELGCGKTVIPSSATPMLPKLVPITVGTTSSGFCVYNTQGQTIDPAKLRITTCVSPASVVLAPTDPKFPFESIVNNPVKVARTDKSLEVPFKIKTKPLSATLTEADVLGTWECSVELVKWLGPATTPPAADAPRVGPIGITFEVE